jgi:ABC-type Fe3+ transport system substrate-binding protein
MMLCKSAKRILTALLLSGFCLIAVPLGYAAESAALQRAKTQAEAKGYIFLTSHDEIVARAKKEGNLNLVTSWEAETVAKLIELFKKKYPFVNVAKSEDLTGTDGAQRFLLELKSGRRDWDLSQIPTDFYDEYVPYTKKFDIVGMAAQGVLKIPKGMIDGNSRKIISLGTSFCVIAFNKKLRAPANTPNSWEDFLKSEYKGRKFVLDLRPKCHAALVPAMGKEWVREYAKKISAQTPVWSRGFSRAITAIKTGEQDLHGGIYWFTAMRAIREDRTDTIGMKIIEPVGAWLSEIQAVLEGGQNPYTGLLWLEFEASPEAQKIVDEYEPLKSSVYAQGSEAEKVLRGRKVSLASWEDQKNFGGWSEMISEAYGFPKASK